MDVLYTVERMLAGLLRSTRRVRQQVGRKEDELARDSHRFWNDPSKQDLKTIMHWRGQGPFDDELWLSLGRRHLSLFHNAVSWTGVDRRLERVVEWGSGGGLNAVHFAPLAAEYFGVDVNGDSLRECVRQVEANGVGKFIPVQIEVSDPEAARAQIPGPCDLFLSTYTFELLPSPEYGLRVLRIAHDILREDGIAIVQVRYHSGLAPRGFHRRDYAANWYRMTTYALDEFWESSKLIGFDPLFVNLVPEESQLDETKYAYFAMRK